MYLRLGSGVDSHVSVKLRNGSKKLWGMGENHGWLQIDNATSALLRSASLRAATLFFSSMRICSLLKH